MSINKYQEKSLSKQEEEKLLKQAQQGCKRSVEQLMMSYEWWVEEVIAKQGTGYLSLDEALQAGRQGLWQCIMSYDSLKGQSLWQKARSHIGVAVLVLSKKVEWRQRRAKGRFISFSQVEKDEDPSQLQKRILVGKEVDELVQRLPERLCHIVVARYGLAGEAPLSFAQIGEELGLSRQRVWQLCHEALCRMSHPPYSQKLRSLLGRHRLVDYQAAQAQIERWLRQRGGRYGR